MKKTTIIKAVKQIYNKNAVLPILETVNMQGHTLRVTDLEIDLSIPYQSGITACIPITQWMAGVETLDNPAYSVVVHNRAMKGEQTLITMAEGKQQIRVEGDSVENFPVPMETHGKGEFSNVGAFDETNMSMLLEGVDFASKDMLRPAMTHVHVFTDVVATDAHRLYWEPLPVPFTQEVFMPVKVIKLMDTFGGGWDVYVKGPKADSYVQLINGEGVTITFRHCDAVYPQYKLVIPEVVADTAVAVFDTKEFRKAIKTGSKFGNKGSKQGILHLNGKAQWHTEDIDFNMEYDTEIPADYKEEIKIGFNWDLLDSILDKCPAKASMNYWGPTKCAIFEGKYLLMPVSLKD